MSWVRFSLLLALVLVSLATQDHKLLANATCLKVRHCSSSASAARAQILDMNTRNPVVIAGILPEIPKEIKQFAACCCWHLTCEP